MATTKSKKRKFSHPDMLREESCSNDSTSSNDDNPSSDTRNQSSLNKKPKFWHSHMVKRKRSNSSENNDHNVAPTFGQAGGSHVQGTPKKKQNIGILTYFKKKIQAQVKPIL